MPQIRIPEVENYLRAIGLLASRGFVVESQDPNVLIVGKREVRFLATENLVDEATLERFDLKKEAH